MRGLITFLLIALLGAQAALSAWHAPGCGASGPTADLAESEGSVDADDDDDGALIPPVPHVSPLAARASAIGVELAAADGVSPRLLRPPRLA